jgi:competence protein ComEA
MAKRAANPGFSENLARILEEYKWSVGVGLIGLCLLVVGLINYFSVGQQTTVEIIPADEQTDGTIWVDLGGAVEKPGVYELRADARVNDCLVKAGGLSAEADRDWVEKNINLAQKLSDGQKIYIPSQEETINSSDNPGSVAGESSKININKASVSELDSLWGIGEARASDIVTNRPYQSIEQLLNQKIIPANVYDRIKTQICVY